MEVAAARARARWIPAVRSSPLGWTAAAIVLVAVLTMPIAVVALGALKPAGEAWGHVVRTLLPGYVWHTIILAVGAGGLATVIGVSCAWLVAMCEFPLRRFFRWALVLPLAIPAYTAAYTYVGMFDVTGPVQRIVRAVMPGGQDAFIYWNVMRIEVLAALFGLVLYPYIFLLTRTFFEHRTGPALEASRLLGRGPWSVFLRIALPLARPAVAGGLFLVLMEILNDYGAVAYYGVTTFTTGIFRSWFSLGDLDSAIRLAAVLMLGVFVAMAIERWQRAGARYDDDGPARPVARYRLRGVKAAAAAACCTVPLLFGFILPVGQLAIWTMRALPDASWIALYTLARNSFGLAAGAAALCVLVAIVLVYAGRLDYSRLASSITKLALLGYSVPGAVIAVGVLVTAITVDRALTGGARLILTGGLGLLVFAYVVRFMAVAYLSVESGFARVGPEFGGAARTLGAGPFRTLLSVELPMLRRTLLAAGTLVFVDVMKELPLTLILRPFNFDTLATRAFQLASDEQLVQSAPAALLIIATATVGVALLQSGIYSAESR
ncbi:MAG TPA: iron ABC transporter permease [Longimicrobiales bacterium]|nr:iron ABC transporter permease [Longimicrobiales bacterium]